LKEVVHMRAKERKQQYIQRQKLHEKSCNMSK
jgi:hypothetical protein